MSFGHIIYIPKYFNRAKNIIFSVLLTIFIFFNRLLFDLNIALLCQCTRNNFIQALMARDNDTIKATPCYRPCKKIHVWIQLAQQVHGGTTS